MNRIKLILVFLATCMLSGAIKADVVVFNHSPYPIQFEMKWIGKIMYWGGANIFDPSLWHDSAKWQETIQPGYRCGRGGEAWNIKTRYIITAKIDGKWQTVIDKKVTDTENRMVHVDYKTVGGKPTWSLRTYGVRKAFPFLEDPYTCRRIEEKGKKK